MISSKELPLGKLIEVLKEYQSSHPVSDEVAKFEVNLEKQIVASLESNWQHDWDFGTLTEFFGDRGVSILIQNRKIDWPSLWDQLLVKSTEMPLGVMINFEVWDNIADNQMVGGRMILRRVILSSGVYAERP